MHNDQTTHSAHCTHHLTVTTTKLYKHVTIILIMPIIITTHDLADHYTHARTSVKNANIKNKAFK